MKRFEVPEAAKPAIRAWLELPTRSDVSLMSFQPYKETLCPFLGISGSCESVCQKMFPSLVRTLLCPCQKLTLNYVIRRAKEIIR